MTKNKLHKKYYNKAGDVVPGTTTVIKILDKPALLPWVAKMTREGKDWTKVRDSAGDVGTLSHYLIECDIKGIPVDKTYIGDFGQNQIDLAESCYLAFLEWKKGFGDFTLICSEKELVSEQYQYGGTIDYVLLKTFPGGEQSVIMIDFKTGSGIYEEHLIQAGAYENLWNENANQPENKISEKYILRLGKEDGAFDCKKLGDLSREFEIFKHCLAIYNLKKQLPF
jgi:hypothetical protein